MKKIAKDSGASGDFKPVLSKKKRKDISLEESIDSETGDTTESESIDIEEKCLVKETSFDYGENENIADKDHVQMPKGPDVKTMKALGKPLGKIDFLDIGLDKVAGKSSQEKLAVVRKLFSKVNGFGGASIPSKFSGIICVFFTSKASLAQVMEKARAANILVNTDLKKSTGHSDWAVVVKEIPVKTSAEAVWTVLSVVSIKIQLVELWQKAVVEFAQFD
ncbi:hypothetical protein G9A89_020850 [Geosiphon pyriformis]|nr:hypothetical protein G9A89_020850 [Geosiphon pyriformis]